MVRCLICIVFLCSASSLQAQSDQAAYGAWGNFRSGGLEYVFADTAIVRSDAGIGYTRLDTLFAGDSIRVVSVSEVNMELKGILAPWVSIQYVKKGSRRQGYLWGGLLALKGIRSADAHFVIGVDRIFRRIRKAGGQDFDWVHDFGVKATRDGILLDKAKQSLVDAAYLRIDGGVQPTGMGLQGVRSLVLFSTVPEMSEMAAMTCRFAWTGTRLAMLPMTSNASDHQGAYAKETLIFPVTKGQPENVITWRQESTLPTGALDKKGAPVVRTKKTEKKYEWDGVKCVPLQ